MLKEDYDGRRTQRCFPKGYRGARQVSMKPGTLRLIKKVKHAYRNFNPEFYQQNNFPDDIDLNKKLKKNEALYNNNRPRG